MTDQGNAGDPYFLVELLAKSLEYIIPKLEKVWGVGTLPELGIVCGSGLSTMADALDAVSLEIPFGNIPNFPLSSVAGHAGLLIFGKIEGLHVVLLSGRVHYYEGYTPQQASYPIFLLSGLGVSSIVLSNAAGGLSINYKVGNIVVITDHLYLAGISGMSPLVGPHIAIPKILSSLRNLSHYTALKSRINGRNSERFTALNGIYSAHLRRLFGQAIVDTGAFEAGQIHCGVYAYTAGPQYESPAETVALRNMGADAVGMSTIPEVLVAAQYGI
ncbi:purine nucleoside phosphorylase, partial [Mitosporidium daphniae]